MNENIRCKELLVITNTGEKLGILSKADALRKADELGLDLVLIQKDGNPAVAKIMDYSKFRYEQQRKAREMKKNQKVVTVQEIRLSPTIEQHDLETKSNNARKMILKGSKVKVTLRLFGRMMGRQDLGSEVVEKFAESLADVASKEVPIKLDGRSLFTILVPKTDKK